MSTKKRKVSRANERTTRPELGRAAVAGVVAGATAAMVSAALGSRDDAAGLATAIARTMVQPISPSLVSAAAAERAKYNAVESIPALLRGHLERMPMGDRVALLRGIGAAVRPYSPIAADELESYVEEKKL